MERITDKILRKGKNYEKRIFKQGMALMLAAALALPANVVPAEILDQQTETELPHIVLNQETPDEKSY